MRIHEDCWVEDSPALTNVSKSHISLYYSSEKNVSKGKEAAWVRVWVEKPRRTKLSSLCMYPIWTWHQYWCQFVLYCWGETDWEIASKPLWPLGEPFIMASGSLRVHVTPNRSAVKNPGFLVNLEINELYLFIFTLQESMQYKYKTNG